MSEAELILAYVLGLATIPAFIGTVWLYVKFFPKKNKRSKKEPKE